MNTIICTLTAITSEIVAIKTDGLKFYVTVEGRRSKARTFDTQEAALACYNVIVHNGNI